MWPINFLGNNNSCISGVSYNQIIDKTFGLPKSVNVITEPVTTAVLIKFAKIDTAMATADASNIAILAIAAREACEAWINTSLVERKVTAVVNNGNGGVKLPYCGGPFEIDSVKYYDGTALQTLTADKYSIQGVEFMQLMWPMYERLTVSYYTGYAPAAGVNKVAIPMDLKLGIMQAFFYMWDNRSQGTQDIGPIAKQNLKKYRRV